MNPLLPLPPPPPSAPPKTGRSFALSSLWNGAGIAGGRPDANLPPPSHAVRRPRAVALLMAVSVLAALVAISVPFLLSMILHGRSARVDLSAAQAQAGAEGALAHGVAHLYRNLLKGKGYDPTPDLDSVDELQAPGLGFNDPYGTIWSCKIEDEQGKINLNTAPPNLIGNLLGSTVLAEPVDRDAAVLTVQNGSVFPTDGNPETIDGLVRVGADTVPYTLVKGGTIFLKPFPVGEPYSYKGFSITRHYAKGALVYDGRATRIASYRFMPGETTFRVFRSIYEVKTAAETPLDADPVQHQLPWAIRPDEFLQFERYITAHSGRDGTTWGKAILYPHSLSWMTKGFGGLEVNQGFGPGTVIRFMQDGNIRTANRIERANLRGNKMSFGLERMLGVDILVTGTTQGSSKGNEIEIEPELRHPVNINTAPPEVIQACLTGLGLRGDTEVVVPEVAHQLAQFLVTKTYRNLEEFQAGLNEAHKRGLVTRPLADAIYINASEPYSHKIRGNTVPFCFRSFGSFTVEGSAVVNAENGVPLARSTLRQVLTLPTPVTKVLELKTQEHFEKLLDQGMARKVVTWPEPLDPPEVRRMRESNRRKPDPDRGSVRLSVGKTGLHKGGETNLLDEWVDHCDDPNDKGYFQEGYDLTARGQAWRLPPKPGSDGGMPTTGVEMWFRSVNPDGAVFFDMAESKCRNRVRFEYTATDGLVLTFWDANLWDDAKRFVRYVWPWKLLPNDWHHVAASWRTSGPGGQEIRVDANPIAQDKPRFEPMTTLAAELNINESNTLSVRDADAAMLPPKGAVQVGDEVIEYEECTGSVLRGLRRGSRNTTQITHPEGTIVTRHGYYCPFAIDHPEGRGLLVEDLGLDTTTTVYMPSPPNPLKFVLDTETKELPVRDASGFPTSGFISVEGEIIYYDGIEKTKGGSPPVTYYKLKKLQREQSVNGVTAPARNLHHGSGVSLCSILITENARYNPTGVVQIDSSSDERKVEWMDYNDRKSVGGKHYLVRGERGINTRVRKGVSDEETPNEVINLGGDLRNVKGTTAYKHDAGAKVIPVACMSGPHCGDQYSAYGESIKADINTVSVIAKGQSSGDLRFIKRAYVHQWPVVRHIYRNGKYCDTVFVDWALEYWVGLDDFVPRRFPAAQAGLLRWPSGELPNYCTSRAIGSSFDGSERLEGEVDEVKVVSLPSKGGKVARIYRDLGTNKLWGDDQGFGAQDSELFVEISSAWPRQGPSNFDPHWPKSGFLRIQKEVDDRDASEFVHYSDLQTVAVTHLADRGFPDPSDPHKKWINRQDDKLNKRIWTHPKTPDNPGGPTEEIHPNYGDEKNDAYRSAPNPPQYDEKKTIIKLSGLSRGLLGSVPDDHAIGASVMLYDAAPFTVLEGSVSDSFQVKDSKGFPEDEGYAWVNDEIVGWIKKNNNSFFVDQFRGRFGTSEGGHKSGDLVRCLPFRYWDRFAPLYDRDGLAFLQAGQTVNNAIWKEFSVKALSGMFNHIPSQHIPITCRPRILVRFNGQPRWDDNPTNQPGGLYQFMGRAGADNVFKFPGRGVAADQIEIRVYWNYVNGAFRNGENQDWKRCFGVEEISATCFSPMVIRRIDEIERR